jgi:homoaconitase/3-isopropylmalate dehydratase large subunit
LQPTLLSRQQSKWTDKPQKHKLHVFVDSKDVCVAVMDTALSHAKRYHVVAFTRQHMDNLTFPGRAARASEVALSAVSNQTYMHPTIDVT